MSYNPAIGRFLERDPIGYDDGMNLYQFVRGSPVSNVDPMGTSSLSICANEQTIDTIQEVVDWKVAKSGRTIDITVRVSPQRVTNDNGKHT